MKAAPEQEPALAEVERVEELVNEAVACLRRARWSIAPFQWIRFSTKESRVWGCCPIAAVLVVRLQAWDLGREEEGVALAAAALEIDREAVRAITDGVDGMPSTGLPAGWYDLGAGLRAEIEASPAASEPWFQALLARGRGDGDARTDEELATLAQTATALLAEYCAGTRRFWEARRDEHIEAGRTARARSLEEELAEADRLADLLQALRRGEAGVTQ